MTIKSSTDPLSGISYGDFFNKLKSPAKSVVTCLAGASPGAVAPRDFLNCRFDGDKDTLVQLEDILGLRDYYGIFDDHKEVSEIRQNLLGNSVKMSEILAPRLYRISREVSGMSGYERPVEFYISSSSEMNAWSVHGFEEEADIIILTSSLIKLMSDDELKFVIGHELGHLLFCHSKPLITYHKIYSGKDDYNPVGNNVKLRWDTYSEVSADRVGFLAAGDIKTVGKVFFKLASGLSEEHLNFNLDEYMRQLDDIDPKKKGAALCSSHPANLIRLKCLQIFISSKLYSKLSGCGSAGISDDELSASTHDVLWMMELVPSDETLFESAKLLGAAGLVLAYSEGELIEKQYQAVYAMLLNYTTVPELFMTFDSPEAALKVLDDSCAYWADKNNSVKFSIYKWIIWAALEDKKLNENERLLLNDMGVKMKIPEKDIAEYIRQVINDRSR